MFDADAVELRSTFAAEVDPGLLGTPRYNLAPTQQAVVLVADSAVAPAPLVACRRAFGWRHPSRGGQVLINARAETVATRVLFRRAWRQARCLVPVRGFFEWAAGPPPRQPVWFGRRDGRLFALAALVDGDGFVIVTHAANEAVGPVHGRMPWALAPDHAVRFTAHDIEAPDPGNQLAAAEMTARPASRTLNSPRNDHPGVLRADS